MSKHDLIKAYLQGELPRRDFVRRLTLTGVSAGAALAYAQTLAPTAGASTGGVLISQAADAPYGGTIDPDDLEAVIQAVIDLVGAVGDFLQAALDAFGPEDFADFLGGSADVFAFLSNLLSQLASEETTLAGTSAGLTLSGVAKRRQLAVARLAQDQTPDQLIADLGDILDTQVQLYAGILIAAEDGETRSNIAGLAIVKGEQAAFVRLLRGEDPFPAEAEEPISLEDAQDAIDAILAD